MSNVPTVRLPGGQDMPMIGFGTFSTWQDEDEVVCQSVKFALETGYRHIDCAYVYSNEAAVGRALKEKFDDGSLKREDVFITTKVWDTHQGVERPKEGLLKSLAWLGVDYVDLYLVHWPFAFKAGEENFPKDADGNIILDTSITLEDTWKGMEKCHDAGLTKNIGISNFNKEQTERILKLARVKPCSMQAELNIYNANPTLVDHCQANGINVTAFAPLGAPNRPWAKDSEPCLMNDAVVSKIAAQKNKTVAQVCLRYLIQLGITVIPKSRTPSRIQENFQLFDFTLSDDDMNQLRALNNNFRAYLEGIAETHPEWPFKVQY